MDNNTFKIVDDEVLEKLESAYQNGDLNKTGEVINVPSQNDTSINPIPWQYGEDGNLYGEMESEDKEKTR